MRIILAKLLSKARNLIKAKTVKAAATQILPVIQTRNNIRKRKKIKMKMKIKIIQISFRLN